MENFSFYIISIIAIIIGIYIIKKIVSCAFRLFITIVLIGILLSIYFGFYS